MSIFAKLRNAISNDLVGAGKVNATTTKQAMSIESGDSAVVAGYRSSVDTLGVALESIGASLKLKNVTESQYRAAAVAAAFAGSPVESMRATSNLKPAISRGGNHAVVPAITMEENYATRLMSTEAYDERENKLTASYTVAYNMMASRQDEFAETLFPTIVVDPMQVGIDVTVKLFTVISDNTRNINGDRLNLQRKNIVRAIADHTVLKNDSTRLVPVVRPENVSKFIDAADFTPIATSVEGTLITTAPLAIGQNMDLIAMSQTAELLAAGLMDRTDSLDTALLLDTIYVDTTSGLIPFNVKDLSYSNFNRAQQNNYRMMVLNFQSTSLLVTANTKRADGSALPGTDPIVINNLMVRFETVVTGSANIETGDTAVYGNQFKVASVQTAGGVELDLTVGVGAAVVAYYADSAILGYDLFGYRSNMNRRQRGQLVDTTQLVRTYEVFLKSPIAALHPAVSETDDASDLASLVATTKIRLSNSAVTTLIEASVNLSSYYDVRDSSSEGPDVLGIGQYYIRPYFSAATIDMNTAINSITSAERAADIQATLINKIREETYRMYRETEYSAAAELLSGGTAEAPTVIIATDPVLANYLTAPGELRTLGNEFKVKVVQTLDKRMAGKIFVTFGVFDGDRNKSINPLNFGNLLWAPELTVVLPVSRNGQVSKELAVSPRFRHMVNLPAIVALQVTNVPNVANNIPVYFHNV